MTVWTQDLKDRVAGLLKAGNSYGIIARAVGVSRASVSGIILRDPALKKIAPATLPTQKLKRAKQSRIAGVLASPKGKPKAPVALDERTINPDVGVVPKMTALADLGQGDCHWPIGDPRKDGFGFCGHPVFEARSYCLAHNRLAYTAVGLRAQQVAA